MDEYLDWFEGTHNIEFAKALMNSQLFATFCDDHYEMDVSNMLIYLNISSNGFDFNEADEKDSTMKDKFETRMSQIFEEVKRNGDLQKQNNAQDSFDIPRQSEESLSKVVNQMEKSAKEKLLGADLAEPIEIKDWPKFQKIDVCWRMPQDNQRVMIFEKLEYALKGYETDRETTAMYQDQNM